MNNLENNEIQEELSNPPLSLLGVLAGLGLVFWLTGIVLDIASVPLGSLTLLKVAKLLVSVLGILICLRIAWVCYGLLIENLSGIKRQQPKHIYITPFLPPEYESLRQVGFLWVHRVTGLLIVKFY